MELWKTYFLAACFCWRMNLSDSSIFVQRIVLGVLRAPKLLTNIFLNRLTLLEVFLWFPTMFARRNSSNFWTRKLKRFTGGTFFRLRRRPRSKSAKLGWPEFTLCPATYFSSVFLFDGTVQQSKWVTVMQCYQVRYRAYELFLFYHDHPWLLSCDL